MGQAVTATRRPVHLWLVGTLSLLWNAFGAFDYVMTKTHNAAYLAGFTVEQRAYFDSFPTVMVSLWAFGVWGALAGALLLLARSRHAVAAFAVSLAGLAGSTITQFALLDAPDSLHSAGMVAMNLVIWAVAIVLLVYARMMTMKGELR